MAFDRVVFGVPHVWWTVQLSMLVPLCVGVGGANAIDYRRLHKFWPWDFKRRKIERWRWLAEAKRSDLD